MTINQTKVPSGIPSLDKIIEGGFTQGDVILVAGQPGAGKTTFATQFLFNGATENAETGIYATFVESADKIKRDMLKFNWDIAKLEQEHKIAVLDLIQAASEKSVATNLDIIMSAVKTLGANRLVIDSLTSMTTYIKTKEEARSFVSMMKKIVEEAKCTTLLLVEIPWNKTEIGSGFEEFVADGLIILESSLDRFRIKRRLYIPKMRGTNHSLDCHDFYITQEGINISTLATAEK
jgi:circadian clock protein KaiC